VKYWTLVVVMDHVEGEFILSRYILVCFDLRYATRNAMHILVKTSYGNNNEFYFSK